jgi:hypothetical protein
MGIAPSILWGRQRQTSRHGHLTTHDPDWLQVDYALLVLLEEWEQSLCKCGQPMGSHAGKTAADYGAAFITCPAIEALDAEQAKRAVTDGHENVKPDPSQARLWLVRTLDELRAMAEATDN